MKIIETKPKTNNMSRETWKYLYKRLGEIANPQLSALKQFLEAPFQIVFTPEEAREQKVSISRKSWPFCITTLYQN